MILRIKVFPIVFLLFLECFAVKEFNKMNLVRVNMSNVVYKRLMVTKDNALSATPLALLDTEILQKYYCYKNIRSNLWSLGIPVIFWNETYMSRIIQSLKNTNQLKGFSKEIVSVLPPAGIIAYRINWRRRYIDNLDNFNITLDSSWQDCQTDYVLPMRHSFIMEFTAEDDSKQLCADTKSRLLNNTLQSSEMVVDFQKPGLAKKKIPEIQIKIKDIRSVKMYDESGCKEKSEGKCYVSTEFAEKWAYDVSTQIMDKADMIQLNFQKDIFDVIFGYLCKEKSQIFKIESLTVKRLKNDALNDMGCKIPKNIYVFPLKPCNPTYDRYGYLRTCRKEFQDHADEVISTITPLHSYNEKSKFTIPILKS